MSLRRPSRWARRRPRTPARFGRLLSAAIVAVTLAGGGAARAQGVALDHPVQLSLTLGPRLAWAGPYGTRARDVLRAYGYNAIPVYGDLSADAAYSLRSFIDIGAHVGYLFASAGAGAYPAEGAMVLHVVEMGGFVRGFLARHEKERTGGLGIGIEGGASIPVLALHGSAVSGATWYLGPSLVLHMSDRARIQPAFRVRYTFSSWPDALGPGVNLPLGGLTVAFGLNASL